MIERFEERRRLLDALKLQKLVNGDEKLAEALADRLKLREHAPGTVFVKQGATDDHVCLILAGIVEAAIHERPMVRRFAGEHVGEMAALRPGGTRIAKLTAVDTVVVACVSEAAISELGRQWPELWRRVASTLADRLEQRSALVRPRNATPVMFIGSSREGIEVAHAIQAGLKYDNVIVRPWTTDGVFGASNFPIEDLEREVAGADFGVLVLTPDDKVTARGITKDAPRDNVVFELGMLIGGIGRTRSYCVVQLGADVKIPSDIFGMNPITYKASTGADLAAHIGPVCTELRRKLDQLGSR